MQGNWEDSGPHQYHFHLDCMRLQDDILIKKKKKKEGLTVFESLKSTVQGQQTNRDTT